jgi:G6PDH family F420-dependent oxidoreductase
MRLLWAGDLTSFEGDYYTVDNARLYTLPSAELELVVAAGGPEAAELAGEIGDGLVATAPDRDHVTHFVRAGGSGPRFGQLTVCWDESEADARRTAFEWWPNAGLRGTLGQELPLPSHFEAAAEMVTEDDVAEAVVCGPSAEAHLEAIESFAEAGFDHVYVHQVGPNQEGFFEFYEREILPEASELLPRTLQTATA